MSSTAEAEITKKKRIRGKSFKDDDDRKISLARLAVSQDPIAGTDQQTHQFWKKVQEHAGMKNRRGSVQ